MGTLVAHERTIRATDGPKESYWSRLTGLLRMIVAGHHPVHHADPTEQMRASMIGWLSVTAILTQFFFAGLNLFRDADGILSLGNLALALFLSISLIIYRLSGRLKTHTVMAMGVVFAWIIWASFRVDPGVLMWTCIFPVPSFLLLGARQGLWWNLLLIAIVSVVLALHGLPFPARFDVLDIPLAYCVVTLLSLIGEIARARFASRLIELSSYDSLTGLLNRRSFEEHAQAELERARRYRHPLGLLLMDADHFKAVNDRMGHAEGDVVLTSLADLVRSTLRTMDRVGRWGGEEFAAILPETDFKAAVKAAERVRREAARLSDSKLRGVTLSIGATEIAADETLQSALRRADAALYEAKRNGRNRVSVKSPRRARPAQQVVTTA